MTSYPANVVSVLLNSLGKLADDELFYKQCPLNGKLEEPEIPRELLGYSAEHLVEVH